MWYVISGGYIVYSSSLKEKALQHLADLKKKAEGFDENLFSGDLAKDAQYAAVILLPYWAVTSDEELKQFGDAYPKHSDWVNGDVEPAVAVH